MTTETTPERLAFEEGAMKMRWIIFKVCSGSIQRSIDVCGNKTITATYLYGV